jgi:hypothetical protein
MKEIPKKFHRRMVPWNPGSSNHFAKQISGLWQLEITFDVGLPLSGAKDSELRENR